MHHTMLLTAIRGSAFIKGDEEIMQETKSKKQRYNTCGIPEAGWKDGFCRACGHSTCEVTDDMIIDGRVYQYAEKHNLLYGGKFSPAYIREMLEQKRKLRIPKYFCEAIACDGLSFDCLAQFPRNKKLRVCRASKDGTFQIGDLVWRSDDTPGTCDGINFVQNAACLDAEFCDQALQGALFEEP